MKKIDFTNIQICGSFEEELAGKTHGVNIAKSLANLMKYSGPVLKDVGFEELAKTIYFSEGPVDVPDEYRAAILAVLEFATYTAAIKRELKKQLT